MTRIIVNQVHGTSGGRIYAIESVNVHLVQGEVENEYGLFAIESIADDVTQTGPKVLLKTYGSIDELMAEMAKIAVAEANGSAYVNLTSFPDPAGFPAE